jgi:hypothetical protein
MVEMAVVGSEVGYTEGGFRVGVEAFKGKCDIDMHHRGDSIATLASIDCS